MGLQNVGLLYIIEMSIGPHDIDKGCVMNSTRDTLTEHA